jgi:transposase
LYSWQIKTTVMSKIPGQFRTRQFLSRPVTTQLIPTYPECKRTFLGPIFVIFTPLSVAVTVPMPSRPKLAASVTQRIEDLLRTNLPSKDIRKALDNKVSIRQINRLTRRLEDFGTVTPASICKTGRPRAITTEAQEDIVEFLIEYDKQAIIKEVRIFIEEEFDIQASR